MKIEAMVKEAKAKMAKGDKKGKALSHGPVSTIHRMLFVSK